jgi:excisionase family DNA binding protein
MTESRSDPIPELISIDQLAGRLGITVRHVRRLVAERRVPYYKVGRLVRFDPRELAAWLDTRRVPGAERPGERLPPARYGDRVGRRTVPDRLGA